MKIFYSVENGGDGSAYPRFYVSEDLAQWHSDHMEEGWGEDCIGSLEVLGDNITCPVAQNKYGYYLDLKKDTYNEKQAKEFAAKFFPEGAPIFTLILKEGEESYFTALTKATGIYGVGEMEVGQVFGYPDTSEKVRLKKERELNE